MKSFPIYLLRLGPSYQVVYPEDRADIGHADFWEQTVSHLVAEFYGIPQQDLANLPYSQRRARIVRNIIYYGGKPHLSLLQMVRNALGNDQLIFVHDDHEKRLREDVREFHKLLRRRKSD